MDVKEYLLRESQYVTARLFDKMLLKAYNQGEISKNDMYDILAEVSRIEGENEKNSKRTC